VFTLVDVMGLQVVAQSQTVDDSSRLCFQSISEECYKAYFYDSYIENLGSYKAMLPEELCDWCCNLRMHFSSLVDINQSRIKHWVYEVESKQKKTPICRENIFIGDAEDAM